MQKKQKSLTSFDTDVVVKESEGNDTIIKIKNSVSRKRHCLGIGINKNTSAFIISFCIYVLMLLGGAGIFHRIESELEQVSIEQDHQDYLFHKSEISRLIKDAVEVGDTSNIEELISDLEEHAAGFEQREEPVKKWTFVNAIFFSFTILSTIGYGTYAPLTTEGRAFLIVYAIIGIPVTAICLARAGERCLHFFRWLSQLRGDKTENAFAYYDKDGSGELDIDEFKSAMEELGYKLTIHELQKLWHIIDFDESGTLDLDEFREVVKMLQIDLTEVVGRKTEIRNTLISMIVWLVIGIFFFSEDDDWSPFISFYFLIVSLTTIGLGDFVPMTHRGALFLVIYGTVGLGLIAIGLTIIQQKILYQTERFKSFKDSYLKSKLKNKLKTIPKYAAMSEDKLDKLITNSEIMKYYKGEKLLEEGTKQKKIFFIVKGKVSLYRQNEQNYNEEISAGSLLFESSVCNKLARDFYIADATALAKSKVKFLAVHIDNNYVKSMLSLKYLSSTINDLDSVGSLEGKSIVDDESNASRKNSIQSEATYIDESKNDVNIKESDEKVIWSFGLY